MTTLRLDTLTDRIKAHKAALINIVKPPVCTERALHYTEAYQQNMDKKKADPGPPRDRPRPSPGQPYHLDQTRRADYR